MSTDTGHVIFASLHSKISKRKAVVGIVGLGYVGLPLAYTLHSSEFRIYGYDTDATKIASLKTGKSYIRHIPPERTSELAASRNFIPTTTFSDLGKCEVVIICLPTPVGSHNEPDMSYVLTSCANLANILEPGTLIILESTTYPGATDTELVKLLSRSGQRCGEEFFVAYSPEREDPGNKDFPTKSIPKLVGGVDIASTALARLFYIRGGFEHTVEVSSARVAECAKLLENTYRAVNIALVNELKGVFESMDVNIWEVLDAASTKPFGFQRFNPGPGIGGHCIPVDPFYLTWKGKETGAPCNFIELAALVNASMPKRVVDKVQLALNSDRKAVNGSTILLFGIAYKPDVDDIREAPSLKIWSLLKDMGALVYYHDPLVPIVCRTRKHGHLAGSQSVMLQRQDEGFLNKYDAIVIITNHSCFADFELLKGYRGPVVDTRNCVPAKSELRVVRA